MFRPHVLSAGVIAATLISLATLASTAGAQSFAYARVYPIDGPTSGCSSGPTASLAASVDCTPVSVGQGTTVAIATGNLFESQSTSHAPGGVRAAATVEVVEPFLLTGTVDPVTIRIYYAASLCSGAPIPVAFPQGVSCNAGYGVACEHPATSTSGLENGVLATCSPVPSYSMQRDQTGLGNSAGVVSVLPTSVLLPFVKGGPPKLTFLATTQAVLPRCVVDRCFRHLQSSDHRPAVLRRQWQRRVSGRQPHV